MVRVESAEKEAGEDEGVKEAEVEESPEKPVEADVAN